MNETAQRIDSTKCAYCEKPIDPESPEVLERMDGKSFCDMDCACGKVLLGS